MFLNFNISLRKSISTTDSVFKTTISRLQQRRFQIIDGRKIGKMSFYSKYYYIYFQKLLAVFPMAVTPITHLCHQIRA
jgi:hypothetical protein